MTVIALAEPPSRGLLDTCVLIDWPGLAPGIGPSEPAVSAISIAELASGVAFARSPDERVRRSSFLADVRSWFDPYPFDDGAAMIYGELAGLVLRSGRQPRARRLDLMIAAVALANGLPLVTSNARDFAGLAGTVEVWEVPTPGNPAPALPGQ